MVTFPRSDILFLPERPAKHWRFLWGCKCPWLAVITYSLAARMLIHNIHENEIRRIGASRQRLISGRRTRGRAIRAGAARARLDAARPGYIFVDSPDFCTFYIDTGIKILTIAF
ncbi:hypothetical protein EVAR_3577_1 [Eumeta japonica]|uniref:Uncharacterized protein n=1 Tax=Eumeta variegata TaxID=151549 RepID=A0A4C1SVG5_EUMVA|nr:hypothetical protein EVAR_3577_1 [Eumeta japonica]